MSFQPWQDVWTEPAERDLARLDQRVAREVLTAVGRYAATGHGDVKWLGRKDHTWRLRVRDWRVIFTRDLASQTIQVLRVHRRDQAYRR